VSCEITRPGAHWRHLQSEQLLAAGLADICRYERGAVHDVQGFSRLAIMVLAEWNDVPALVLEAVFLNTGAKF